MAVSKDNIKGLTVEIGGDVTPLTKALKSSEEAAQKASKELGKINAALKFDPTNVTLLTQKQKLLTEQSDALKKKLETLRAGEEAAHKAVADGAEGSEEALREIQREIVFTTAKLDKLKSQSDETAEALKKSGQDGASAQKDVKNAAEKTEKSVKDIGDAAQDSGGKVSSFGDVLKGSLAADVISSACRTIVNGIRSVGSALSEQLDNLGDLDDNAQKVGMSAEALQEWQYAAKLGGMETETLVKALEKQQKSFADAKTGSASLTESYAALGVSVAYVESSEDALNAVIDALADLDDETQRNALANDIFGKSYAELAPLLNFGSEGIAELRQEARDLGLVLSNETVAATAEAGDSFDRLTGMIDTAKSSILAGMLPSLVKVADSLREKLNTASVQKQLKKLGTATGELAEDAADLALKLLPKLASAMQTVSRNGGTALTVLISGLTTIRGFKLGSSITGFIPMIKGLWAAISANPVGAVITVLGALVTALGVLDLATESQVEKQQKLAETYRDAADAAAESAEERANAGEDIREEASRYDDLIAELDELVDADGRVREGYEDRVEYILGELSEASGQEISMVDGVILKYDKLTASIRDSIAMRQAEDYLTSGKTDYDAAREAIGSLETDENGNYVAGSQAALEAARENAEYWSAIARQDAEIVAELGEIQNALAGVLSLEDRTALEARRYELEGEVYGPGLEATVKAAQDALTSAEYVYDLNRTTVEQYEAVQSGVWAQDIEATAEAMDRATGAMMDAQTAATSSLERQRDDALATYNKFKEWAATSGSSVTAEQVKAKGEKALTAATEALKSMLSEGENYTQEEIENAYKQVTGLLAEVRGMSMSEIADYLDDVRAEASRTGEALVDGVTSSIEANAPKVTQTVRDRIGIGTIKELRANWEIASPSKASARAAGFFTEGIRRQFEGDTSSTLAAVRRYADGIRDTFDGGMTLAAIEQTARAAEFGHVSNEYGSSGSVDLNAICARLDKISTRLNEMETTMVLDDGTLIARTDNALGETAALRERGGLMND